MIDGSEKRKRQLAFEFRIRVFLKSAVRCSPVRAPNTLGDQDRNGRAPTAYFYKRKIREHWSNLTKTFDKL